MERAVFKCRLFFYYKNITVWNTTSITSTNFYRKSKKWAGFFGAAHSLGRYLKNIAGILFITQFLKALNARNFWELVVTSTQNHLIIHLFNIVDVTTRALHEFYSVFFKMKKIFKKNIWRYLNRYYLTFLIQCSYLVSNFSDFFVGKIKPWSYKSCSLIKLNKLCHCKISTTSCSENELPEKINPFFDSITIKSQKHSLFPKLFYFEDHIATY